jgi:short-subunit dehydrogenase
VTGPTHGRCRNDPAAVDRLRATLTARHSDTALLVNTAGVFAPKPFPVRTGDDYDRYQAINRALFFRTRTIAAGIVKNGAPGSIVNIGSMGAHQAIAAPRHRRTP